MAARKDHLQHIHDLEKKDEKKTEFFLAASHQLKSPLAIIQWCLQTAVESPTLHAKDKEMVLKSLTQANAMSHLVSDMLHVFRLVNRKGRAQTYTPVEVNTIIDQIIGQYEVMAHKHKVHILRGPIEVLPPVFVDEAYFRQAIINLLDNAIKYSPAGSSVTITATTSKDHWLEVSVTDQGIGMTEADQTKLFSEFFRTEEAREIAHEGTGLGLVLAKHVIEEFGGEIRVKSELHQGSTFTVRLPIGKKD